MLLAATGLLILTVIVLLLVCICLCLERHFRIKKLRVDDIEMKSLTLDSTIDYLENPMAPIQESEV
jgi:hypothetical protein